jgi:hypothetical protein
MEEASWRRTCNSNYYKDFTQKKKRVQIKKRNVPINLHTVDKYCSTHL